MKRNLILAVVMAVMMTLFGVCAHAANEPSDFSNPVDGDVDGKDLYDFSSIYSPGYAPGSLGDINKDDYVNEDDVAAFAGAFGSTYSPSTAEPNILLIIADDIGIDVTTDLYPGLLVALEARYGSGVYGHAASVPQIRDRIANQGMVFSSAWAQPVCSPTRAAVITGLFADKTQVKAPGNPLSINHTTFVQRLSDAGYSTAIFGKWHLGTGSNGVLPQQAGFDVFKGNVQGYISPTFWNYSYHVQDENTTNPASYSQYSAPTRNLPGIADTTYAPVVKAADTIEWIADQENANPDKPWFVWLAFNEAHWYLHVPDESTMDATTRGEVAGCGGSCSDEVLVRAMTNAMDTVIGKVLDAIEDPNTYLIFIGDNGTDNSYLSNAIDNMYLNPESAPGKGSVYESGTRVAMVIKGPGITSGSQSSEFVHVTDLYNTCLNLAGLPSDIENQDLNNQTVDSDSKSLTPILFGTETAVRNPNEGYILTETSYSGNKVGARNATYKVVCTSTTNCTFYDLVDDPLEEYPLDEPANCTDFRSTWTSDDPEWNYCRLLEVVAEHSIF